MTSKILAAALFSAVALAFVAAPFGIDPASGTIATKAAFAKHGADDVVPPQEPQPADDRGGL